MTIADQVKAADDPYRQAALFQVFQHTAPVDNTVTMYFEDGSSITFKVSYEVLDDSI